MGDILAVDNLLAADNLLGVDNLLGEDILEEDNLEEDMRRVEGGTDQEDIRAHALGG